MKKIQKSVLLWHSAQQMYDLVVDVAKYPEFLPWCDRVDVLEQNEAGMTAQIGISFGGVRQRFTTRNRHVPGKEMRMELVDGPFSRLDGQWHFVPVGDASQDACRVELALNYGFSSRTLAVLVGPVFDHIATTLVDAFVKRAEQVYAR